MTLATSSRCSTCFELAVSDTTCSACGAEQAERNRDRRALPAGTDIHSKYLVGRVLGSGGFGITYLAKDLVLDRRVALKEFFPVGFVTRGPDRISLNCNGAEDEAPFRRGLNRFFRESQILAKFDHPNIVRVHDVIEANATAYLAMEYLDGMTLKQWIASSGALEPAKALQVMGFILDALKAVHGANVVHRDIKPDNVYITTHGRTLLLDFGGAKQLTPDGDRSMDAMFAHGYTAPEQYVADSSKVGPWTDIYACGATLYKMLTAQTMRSALDRFSEDGPLDWPSARVPAAMRTAVECAVSLKIAERFQSVRHFERALAGEHAHISGSHPASSGVARRTDWHALTRRHRGFIGAGVAVAGIAVAALLWHASGPERVAGARGAGTPRPMAPVGPPRPSATTTATDASTRRIDAGLDDLVAGANAMDWPRVETAARQIRADPANAAAREPLSRHWRDAGEAAIEQRDYRSAVDALRRACDEDAGDWRAWSALGYAWLRVDQPDQARQALAKSLRLRPDNGAAWMHLGEILAIDKNLAGGTAALRLAVYFSPQRRRTLAFLRDFELNGVRTEFEPIILADLPALEHLPLRTP